MAVSVTTHMHIAIDNNNKAFVTTNKQNQKRHAPMDRSTQRKTKSQLAWHTDPGTANITFTSSSHSSSLITLGLKQHYQVSMSINIWNNVS